MSSFSPDVIPDLNHSLQINQTVHQEYHEDPGWIPPDVSFYPNNSLNSNVTAFDIPMYYSTMFRWIAVSLGAIIFTVGMAGNILVVVVICRTKCMHTTTNCYLISLAIADCIVLLSATLPSIPEPFFQINEWPFGRVMCSLLVFLQYVGVNASSLSITAFTIERYIAICHPIRAQTICTTSRAKRIIICLWIFTTCYGLPWLGLTEIRVTRQVAGDVEKCVFRLKRQSYLVYYMTDLILFYVIPFILAAVLYCLIGRVLYITSNMSCTFNNNAKKGSDLNSKRTQNSRIQVVRMLAVIVLMFATLWMPYRVMVVYNSFAQQKYMDLWFLLFSRMMIYVNSAINPILYNVMSIKFRRAFKNHLRCGSRPPPSSMYVYSEMATEVMLRRTDVRNASNASAAVRDGAGRAVGKDKMASLSHRDKLLTRSYR